MSPEPTDRTSLRHLMQSVVAAAQHRAATALGVNEQARTETVAAMLENNSRRAPGYWIQLTLAMGIATVGLVLGSTAVVIGAMLVSPLMGPILELGMGFAVGSSFLVLRASLRVGLSVFVVVGGAALLTLALPFHEITAEIAARAAPTALDLLVAVFCALTAAYTTVRSASDTTSAAAGTAIGIALVPPLCVAGFGVGTASAAIAGGAALLFTANLSAILVLSVLSFLVLGYNQVDATRIEHEYVRPDQTRTGRLAAGTQAVLRRAFGSRYSLAMRVIIPAVFLAGVYVPLVRALDEVTWEVRARDAIRHALSADAPSAVQTAITVERHTIALHLVLIGSNEHAAGVQQSIESRIAATTGVVPSVAVTAVPDAKTLAAATAATRVAGSAVADAEGIDLATLRQRVAAAVGEEWPTAVAGPLAGWDLIVPAHGTPTIQVRHIGPELGPAAQNILAGRWAVRVGAPVAVEDVPLAKSSASGRLGREEAWLASARPILEWAGAAERVHVCVSGPVSPSRVPTRSQRDALAALRSAAVAKAGRLAFRDSTGWNIRAELDACAGEHAADSSRVPRPDST